MKKYPFKVLLVKIGENYQGRVVYQEGSPRFDVDFLNQRDQLVSAGVKCSSCFEFGVHNNGGTLFLRGDEAFADHHSVRITNTYYYINDMATSLNKSIKEMYDYDAGLPI